MIIPTHKELTFAMGDKPAFVDEAEISVLCHYAAHAKRIVEIGCAWGGSTALLLANMPDDAHLSSIDPFVPDSYGGWVASQGECVQAVYRALAFFGQLSKFKEWSLIPHTSEYVAERWEAPTPINLLYIDGDHSEDGVQTDFRNWALPLNIGSVVMLHDSCRIPDAPDEPFPAGYPAPTALANNLRVNPNWKLLDEAFSLTVWEKLT